MVLIMCCQPKTLNEEVKIFSRFQMINYWDFLGLNKNLTSLLPEENCNRVLVLQISIGENQFGNSLELASRQPKSA